MSDKFVIQGGTPLRGAAVVGGAKNVSFKLMIASLLADSHSRLLNLSHISDVHDTQEIIRNLGVKIETCGTRTLFVNPKNLKKWQINPEASEKTRAATLFIAPFLKKFGKAVIALPGGDQLGERPVNWHLESLEALGVKTDIKNNHLEVSADKLHGATYTFPKNTHTGTEAMIMVAAFVEGETTILNAAEEPEIDDLILFLNHMGAKIKRWPNRKIKIIGVKKFQGAIHRAMPDRNAAVTYACAALATGGDIVIENAVPDHLQSFLEAVSEAGGNYQTNSFGIRFWVDKPLKATNIITSPEPGFMTDWQPLWSLVMTQAHGTSTIIEAVHNWRFDHAQELARMGAKIELFQPEVENPKEFYNFDQPISDNHLHGLRIIGPTPLEASILNAADLRAGSTLTIAATIAHGTSTINNVHHIDRGYESLDKKLRDLGAKIKRVKAS